jgi:hypothetical protein
LDFRHFELHDLLCEALIALEGGNAVRAGQAVRRAMAWVEADWLATPSSLPAPRRSASAPAAGPSPAPGSAPPASEADDEDE